MEGARGGEWEGEGKGKGGWGGRQLGPSALWKTHRLLWKHRMWACRQGFRHPLQLPPQHTHKDTHNCILSIPLLTLSCLPSTTPGSAFQAFIKHEQPSALNWFFQCRGTKKTLFQQAFLKSMAVYFTRSLHKWDICDGKHLLGGQTFLKLLKLLQQHTSDWWAHRHDVWLTYETRAQSLDPGLGEFLDVKIFHWQTICTWMWQWA